MICHWSCTNWEKLLPSIAYGVIFGRTVLEPDALVGLWKKVHRGRGGLWECCD